MFRTKMVVTDLDGTLLNNDKEISEYTYEVLKKLKDKKILFVIATARPRRAAKKYFENNLCDYAIYHNGALVHDEVKAIKKIGIPDAITIVNSILADFPSSPICIEANDQLYANFEADTIWKGEKYIYTDFENWPNITADKIIIETNSLEKMEVLKKYLSVDQYIQMSENKIAMIMNKNAKKLNAIRFIAKASGINCEEIVSFGDDYNDMEMLQWCGKGIAVENALKDVKEMADEICDSNQTDGVAKWIEKNIL